MLFYILFIMRASLCFPLAHLIDIYSLERKFLVDAKLSFVFFGVVVVRFFRRGGEAAVAAEREAHV